MERVFWNMIYIFSVYKRVKIIMKKENKIKNQKRILLIISLFITILFFGLIGFVYIQISSFLSISNTYIDSNIPAKDKFNKILLKDFNNYVKLNFDKEFYGEYKMISEEPYQVGLSYPKYYIYVYIYSKNRELMDQGILQIVAIEKKEFKFYDFYSLKNKKIDEKKYSDDFLKKVKTLIK